jgi:hypothetical protein
VGLGCRVLGVGATGATITGSLCARGCRSCGACACAFLCVCVCVCVCTAGLFHQLSVRLCPSLTVRQVVSPLQSFGGGSGVPSFAFPSPLTAGGGSKLGAFLSPFPLRLCIASVCVCVRSLNLAYVG